MWPQEPPTEKSGRLYRPEQENWDCGCPNERYDFASAIKTASGVRRWRHDKCGKYVGISRESDPPAPAITPTAPAAPARGIVAGTVEYLQALYETRFF
jgi:hypothetical protein